MAAYLPGEGLECQGYGIMVITVDGDTIASITGFPSPDLFPAFGLPMTLDAIPVKRILTAARHSRHPAGLYT